MCTATMIALYMTRSKTNLQVGAYLWVEYLAAAKCLNAAEYLTAARCLPALKCLTATKYLIAAARVAELQQQARQQVQQQLHDPAQRHGAQRGHEAACDCKWCVDLRAYHTEAKLQAQLFEAERVLNVFKDELVETAGKRAKQEQGGHGYEEELGSQVQQLAASIAELPAAPTQARLISKIATGTGRDVMDSVVCEKVDGQHKLSCLLTLLSEKEKEKINSHFPDNCQIQPCTCCGWDRVFGPEFEEGCQAMNSPTEVLHWKEYEICREKGDQQAGKRILTNKSGTRRGLYDSFKQYVHEWALHYFIAGWNNEQVDQILNKLQPSQLLSFWDFSENYEHLHQNEIQRDYYCHTQSTLLINITFYRNTDGVLVSEVNAYRSADRAPQSRCSLRGALHAAACTPLQATIPRFGFACSVVPHSV